jgi:mono/diheme cytochrome c family protein
LNLLAAYPGDVRTNQIGAFIAAGYLTNAPAGLHRLATFAPPAVAESTEWKVRRYLDVNCAFCHQPGALGGGLWDARASTPTDLAGLIRGPLTSPHGGPDARVIAPGNPSASALLDRMARRDGRRMPPVGSNEVDDAGAALLTSWIHSLTNQPTFPEWLQGHLGANTPANPNRTADTDRDGDPDYLEFLTGTDPTRPESRWRPGVSQETTGPTLRWTVPANTTSRVEAMDTLTGTWEPLDISINEPVFRAEAFEQSLALPTEGTTGFYRIQLWRP